MPRHILRPLPAKNASPKKSSLRSPLKPRTPGRVVEFSNSVLSPLDQAAAREHHLAASNAVPSRAPMPQAKFPPARAPSPSKAQPQQASARTDLAAEKPALPTAPLAPSIAGKPAAPPQPQPQPPEPEPEPEPERLSGTIWSRKHWLLLDSLLRRRRQRPLAPPTRGQQPTSAEKLLGKTVKSQGKALRLERWHLDCVEAFQAQVAGWDEAVLAKRLVALILGEERRQRMALKKAVRTTFH
ncbi:hypothetical protein ESCO_003607 [Escovopsis weberi]|uniref:Uncharacterized protein n=1 Tax=Escovopsis weberi TaxID=150374 RepID=A0A0M8N0X7_ESCWE|nr:hypothetical protein ESCO_003607 [Escovopsis weberi]